MARIRIADRDAVRILTLDSPFTQNAWTVDMHAQMSAALSETRGDPQVRAVVVTGAGDRAFCAGQDQHKAAAMGAAERTSWLVSLKRVFGAVISCDKPVVAAIRGVAFGSGLQLALLCDIRVANPDARLGQPEIADGIPSISGSYLIRQFIGHGLASAMMLGGRILSGDEAVAVGLVERVVPGSGVLDAAIATAQEMAQIPPETFAATKQALRAQIGPGLAHACDQAIAAGMSVVNAQRMPQE